MTVAATVHDGRCDAYAESKGRRCRRRGTTARIVFGQRKIRWLCWPHAQQNLYGEGMRLAEELDDGGPKLPAGTKGADEWPQLR